MPYIAFVWKASGPGPTGVPDQNAIAITVTDETLMGQSLGSVASWSDVDPTSEDWFGDGKGTGVCVSYSGSSQDLNGKSLPLVDYQISGATKSVVYKNDWSCSDFRAVMMSATVGPSITAAMQVGGHIYTVEVSAKHDLGAAYSESQMQADISAVDVLFASLHLRIA